MRSLTLLNSIKMANFNIREYLSSIIGYPVPEKTIDRIAHERGLIGIEDWADVPRRERNLAIADILFFIFTSPNDTGNKTKSHGDQTLTVGGVRIYDKNDIYSLMMYLYQHPDEELGEALANIGGCQWMS